MSVYLSVGQAQNIVFELIEIIPKGVSVIDESGIVIASSNPSYVGSISDLAKTCIEQSNTDKFLYMERYHEGNRTVTPIFFRELCVGAIEMLGNPDRIKRLTSIAKSVGEHIICQPYFSNTNQVSHVVCFEYLTEWLNYFGEYSTSFTRRGVREGIDVTKPYYVVIMDGIWNIVSAQKALQPVIVPPNYFLCRDNGSIAIILLKQDNDKDLLQKITEIFHDIKLGVGTPEANLNQSYLEAQSALEIGKRLHITGNTYYYDTYEFLIAISKMSDLKISQSVMELFEHAQYVELLQTFEVYIQENGNVNDVARKLYIHRNTLKYRLDKIQEITGKNPRCYEELFYLYVVYVLHKLM